LISSIEIIVARTPEVTPEFEHQELMPPINGAEEYVNLLHMVDWN